MKRTGLWIALALVASAGVAQAKLQAQNPAVKARIAGMEEFRTHMKVLGNMAKGTLDYNAAQAAEALAAMQAGALTIVPLFEANEADPASEAKPAIWSNFDDFKAEAEKLVAAAQGADVSSEAGVQAAVQAMGVTCKSCHDKYSDD
mgnify:CR=1 FL=1